MRARHYTRPLAALELAPLSLPRTSLNRAFWTVLRRLARRSHRRFGLTLLALLMALCRWQWSMDNDLYWWYNHVARDPRRACQAWEGRRAASKRHQRLRVQFNRVLAWRF